MNVAGILAGSALGLLLGNRLPERSQETVMHGLGIITLVIGFQMALGTKNILIVLFAVLIGCVLGEGMRLDDRLNVFARHIELALSGLQNGASVSKSISHGFVASSLLFCVGPIAILGPIQEGLLGDHRLLIVKSALDFFASIALSAGLGVGVAISAASVLIYQGALGLATYLLGHSIGGTLTADAPFIVELTATGGIVIVALGVNLLELKKIRVANLLPAVFLAPAFVALAAYVSSVF